MLQIANAQYVVGAMPMSNDGPDIESFDIVSYQVAPGATDRPLQGTLAENATGAAFGLDGDRGYWVVPAGQPDTEAPTFPRFDLRMSFAISLPAETVRLVGRAVDAQGRFGAPRSIDITVVNVPIPIGHLVVSLTWDHASDLDLHVVDPTGAEIWANNPSAYLPPAPPAQPDPVAIAATGALDRDSNSQCVIDGFNREDVIYATTAPSGHYVVRVDAFSLCGQALANWRAEAFVDGESLGRAMGTSTDSDTIGAHARGAGMTAFDFVLP